jgi:hypothetical protein
LVNLVFQMTWGWVHRQTEMKEFASWFDNEVLPNNHGREVDEVAGSGEIQNEVEELLGDMVKRLRKCCQV